MVPQTSSGRQRARGTIQFECDRRVVGGTLDRDLAFVRRIVLLAARPWRDGIGLTWLETAPLIRLLPNDQARKPYPLSWGKQQLQLTELDAHLVRMAPGVCRA
ncbi:MAG: hypothetical protein KDI32_04895 [Pseudomonadales bacterium]|nr:hypothetical protein [Pseudomonadales bacterium]